MSEFHTNVNSTPQDQALGHDESHAVPRIVMGQGSEQDVVVDQQAVANTMRELGISDEAISSSAIYIDPKNRFLNNGTHYQSGLGRRRFRSNEELQDVEGDIVRLTTRKRYKDRPTELMNKTLVHEIEHQAQEDREDKKVTAGHIAIWGLATVGALLGYKFGGRKGGAMKPIATAAGAYLGHSVGYRIAPHERQARKRAGQMRGRTAEVTTNAITRRSEQ